MKKVNYRAIHDWRLLKNYKIVYNMIYLELLLLKYDQKFILVVTLLTGRSVYLPVVHCNNLYTLLTYLFYLLEWLNNLWKQKDTCYTYMLYININNMDLHISLQYQ